MKILFISEALSRPFDEGIKNVAFSLHKQFETTGNSLSVTIASNNTDDLNIEKVYLNKSFISNNLKILINEFSPDVIVYQPEASITFNSFIRAKVLKIMSNKSSVILLGVKHIEYNAIQKKIIASLLKPDYLMLLGKFEMDFFRKAGMKVKILRPAVDCERFHQAEEEEKKKYRDEYNVSNNKKVALHVGHIRTTRNVECLLKIQEIDELQVVIVGSTSTVVDLDIKTRLEKAGIRVINEFVSDISKCYKMSDMYIFPVFDKIACIDMPLSVLEAMACNLPVITTRFGGLEEHFKEDAGFRYFDTIEELIASVKMFTNMDVREINNSRKVVPFTWSKFTDEILVACDKLV